MSDILMRLLHGEYYPTPFLTKKQQELSRKLLPYHDAVERWLGLEFVDQMNALENEIAEISEETAFTDGFRLGAQLMLEALTPLSAPSSAPPANFP